MCRPLMKAAAVMPKRQKPSKCESWVYSLVVFEMRHKSNEDIYNMDSIWIRRGFVGMCLKNVLFIDEHRSVHCCVLPMSVSWGITKSGSPRVPRQQDNKKNPWCTSGDCAASQFGAGWLGGERPSGSNGTPDHSEGGSLCVPRIHMDPRQNWL